MVKTRASVAQIGGAAAKIWVSGVRICGSKAKTRALGPRSESLGQDQGLSGQD